MHIPLRQVKSGNTGSFSPCHCMEEDGSISSLSYSQSNGPELPSLPQRTPEIEDASRALQAFVNVTDTWLTKQASDRPKLIDMNGEINRSQLSSLGLRLARLLHEKVSQKLWALGDFFDLCSLATSLPDTTVRSYNR